MTPVLLVPGLNCTSRVYRDAVESLWPLAHVMVANHCEGEGIVEIAANILAAAPPRFSLAGFSFGGYLAFEILRQARDRVERLALLDTSARADTAETTATRERRIALAEAGKFGLVVQQSFPASVHPAHRADPNLLSIHAGMALANGPVIYVRQQLAIIARPDSRPELGRIDIPTMVLVGEADEVTPLEMAHEMREAIPASRLVVIPEAGHMTLIEQPAAVGAALADWLHQA